MLKYINLIRYQNLFIIALSQIIVRYGLFKPFNIDITLSNFGFILLVLSTICIAAAGNIINDIFDRDIDLINKPEKVIVGKSISEKTAYNLFIILNVTGVAIGFYLSNIIGKPAFAAMFIAFSALLYLYSSYLKGILLIGNLLISSLVAMSIVIVGLFDLLPAITPANQSTQSTIFSIVLDYALFALAINFIRELVKDLQDINGDKKGNLNTLPIALGRKRAAKVVFGLGALLVFAVVYYMYEFFYSHTTLLLYFLFAIVAPMLFFCIKAWGADSNKEYRLLSNLLKIVMVTGICSMLLFQYVLK